MTGFEALAGILAERALNCIPEGLLIAALSWLALRVFGTPSSATRFAAWFVTLLAIIALPFAPALSSKEGMALAFKSQVVLDPGWATAIFVCWTVIAALAGIRLALGVRKLKRLRTSCTPIQISDFPTLQAMVEQFRRIRSVEICRSSALQVPTAIGFLKPVIVVPEWALAELSEDDLKAVVLHELAHLRRRDDWTNLAQKMLRAVFFFHPAVWWVDKKLALEREMACDELVLAETGNRRAYAECLVSLAEKNVLRRGLAMAQALLSRAHETSLRLERILHSNQPRAVTARVFQPALAVTAGVAIVGVVLLGRTPKLIAFQPAPQQPAASAVNVPSVGVDGSSQALADVSRNVVNAALTTTTGAVKPNRRSTSPARIIPARQKQVRRNRALLVRTAAQEPAPEQRMILIVQTTEFNGAIPATVRFCVWRVTFDDGPDGRAVRTEIIAKSI
jgi:beta-lactamase regulating signal transducer with metallopeptidase domain